MIEAWLAAGRSKSMINLQEIWDKHSDEEYLKFDRVQNKLTQRRDLHAFMMLDKLLPYEEGERDIVSCAEHDEIWFSIDLEKLAAGETVDQILEAHPRLTHDGIHAALAFAAEVLKGDIVYPVAEAAA